MRLDMLTTEKFIKWIILYPQIVVWGLTLPIKIVKHFKNHTKEKLKNTKRKKLKEELDEIKTHNLSHDFNRTITEYLEKINTHLGNPFNYKSFGLTLTIACIYPIFSNFLIWVFEGKNASRIPGFLNSGSSGERWILFSLVLFLFLVILYRRKKKVTDYAKVFGVNNTVIYIYCFLADWITYTLGFVALIYFEWTFVNLTIAVLSLGILFYPIPVDLVKGGVILCETVSRIILIAATNLYFLQYGNSLLFSGFVYIVSSTLILIASRIVFVIFEKNSHDTYIICFTNVICYIFLSYVFLANSDMSIISDNVALVRQIVSAFIFFILLPLINAIIDYLSFNFTRIFFDRIAKNSGFLVHCIYLGVDLILAFVFLIILAATFFLSLSFINSQLYNILENSEAIGLTEIIKNIESNPVDSSNLWLYMLLFSTFIPTLINYLVFIIKFFKYKIFFCRKKIIDNAYAELEKSKKDYKQSPVIKKAFDCIYINSILSHIISITLTLLAVYWLIVIYMKSLLLFLLDISKAVIELSKI